MCDQCVLSALKNSGLAMGVTAFSIPGLLYKPRVALTFFGDPKKNHPICRFVGTEIEFFQFDDSPNPAEIVELHRAVKEWGGDIVKDWQNTEIRLSPAIGEAYERQITEVSGILKTLGAKVVHMPDIISGLHIHIDARDLKIRHLGRVMTIYSRIEPWIVKSQPYNRMSAKFCRASGPDLALGWEGTKYATTQAELFDQKVNQIVPGGNKSRYKAVNFAAYYKHSTIEIRCHEGSIDAAEIIPWAAFWSQFVEHTSKIPMNVGRQFPTTLTALKELVGEPGASYLKTRLEKYASQWTEDKLAKVIPEKTLVGSCQYCGKKTLNKCCGVYICRKEWQEHKGGHPKVEE
jgi:hypothetical protein